HAHKPTATSTREVLAVKKRDGALFSGHLGVGRTQNLDICIARSGVSKFQAYFSVDANGEYQLTDKESKNGTFVGGVRLAPGASIAVPDDVEVSFAGYVFRFLKPDSFYRMLQ